MQLRISPSMRSITISGSNGFLDSMKVRVAERHVPYRTLFHTILALAFLLPFVFILTAVVTLECVNKCSLLPLFDAAPCLANSSASLSSLGLSTAPSSSSPTPASPAPPPPPPPSPLTPAGSFGRKMIVDDLIARSVSAAASSRSDRPYRHSLRWAASAARAATVVIPSASVAATGRARRRRCSYGSRRA